ncbi:MAG: phosphonoacetaldehyde hydrolase [Comamonadaceae bacterium]|nr:MAG: phosphonoacetaldehyde hydrolase [Comamonadaceae bacterium]
MDTLIPSRSATSRAGSAGAACAGVHTGPAEGLAPLQAVIFDWAGTLVDFGSLAPTQIFVQAFASFGLQITLEQARGPMGLSKWDHIHTLLQQPDIAAQWRALFGQLPGNADVDAIYARFMPLQIAKVAEYSAPIEGVPQTLQWLRAQGLQVGSCSGYPREVLDKLLPAAALAGVQPDHVVAGDEMAAGGRPGPFMALANVLALGISDVRACVKVDDTVPGIEEGRNAGMWCVGVSLSGNEVGLSLDEYARASSEDVAARVDRAEKKLLAAGAHFVVRSVQELPPVLAAIAAALREGQRP